MNKSRRNDRNKAKQEVAEPKPQVQPAKPDAKVDEPAKSKARKGWEYTIYQDISTTNKLQFTCVCYGLLSVFMLVT